MNEFESSSGAKSVESEIVPLAPQPGSASYTHTQWSNPSAGTAGDAVRIGATHAGAIPGGAPTPNPAPAPAPAPPYGAQPIYVTQQVQMVQPYAIATPPKSMAASLLLTFFFGPLGMFYATVPGALIMLVISIVVGIATLGFGLLITGPICVIWAAVATSNYNQRIALAAGVAPTQVVR